MRYKRILHRYTPTRLTMNRSLLSVSLLLALASSQAPAQDLQGPTWKPLAFQVVKPDGEEKNALGELGTGTRVVARLELPGQKIITIDPAKSQLDSFTDDVKTDLLAAPAVGAARPFGPPLQITSGRSPLLSSKPNDITFHAPECPARGATKVRIKGSVTVIVGKAEKEVEKKDVVLKTGVDLDFGSLKPPTTFTTRSALLSYEGTRPIASITFVDADGKEIPSRFTSTYRPAGPAGKPSCRASIAVTDVKVERCTVRIKYFDSVAEVKVPVDLEVGPGL